MDVFIQAAIVLYSSGSTPEQRRDADQWIQTFQKSNDAEQTAWKILDGILSTQASALSSSNQNQQILPETVIFLAALCMNQKIRYDLDQLPRESLPSLRDSLLGILAQAKQFPKSIRTQLCLALSSLAVQMESGWNTPIVDISKRFGTDENHFEILLELLQRMSEEYTDPMLDIAESVRMGFCREIQVVSNDVFLFLESLIVPERLMDLVNRKMVTVKQILLCLGSWVQHGDIPAALFARSSLLQTLLSILAMPAHQASNENLEACIFAMIEIVHHYQPSSAKDDADNMLVINAIVPTIVQLGTKLRAAVVNEDDSVSIPFAALISHAGEVYLPLLLMEPVADIQLGIVESVLACFASPSPHQAAGKSVPFWFGLIEGLSNAKKPQQGRANIAHMYRALLERLIEECMLRSRLPMSVIEAQASSTSNENEEDEEEEFMQHRDDIAELLTGLWALNVVNASGMGFSGSDVILRKASTALEFELHSYLAMSVSDRVSKADSWVGSEAILSVLKAIAGDLAFAVPDSPGHATVFRIVEFVVSQLSGEQAHHQIHPKVYRSAFEFLGDMSHFYGTVPTLLDPVLRFLVSGLQMERASRSAAMAIKQVCVDCKRDIAGVVRSDQTLAIDQRYRLFMMLMSQNGTASSARANLSLLEGIVEVASLLDISTGASALQELTKRSVELLAQVSEANQQINSGTSNMSVIMAWIHQAVPQTEYALDVLTIVGGFYDVRTDGSIPHPFIQILESIWGNISSLAFLFAKAENVIESLCKMLRRAMQKAPIHFARLINPTMTLIVSAYEREPQSPYLYLAAKMADEYARNREMVPMFMQMFDQLCRKTFAILCEPDKFVVHPNFVEDLFYLAEFYVGAFPVDTVALPVFELVFSAAINYGMKLEHHEAGKSATSFLDKFLQLGRQVNKTAREVGNMQAELGGEKGRFMQLAPIFNRLMSEGLEPLICNCLFAIVGNIPEERVTDRERGSISSVLWSVWEYVDNDAAFLNLVAIAIDKEPTCRGIVTMEQKKWAISSLADGLMLGYNDFHMIIEEWTHRARRRKLRQISESN